MSDETKPKTAKEQLAEVLALEAEEARRSKDEREEQAAATELERRKKFRELKAELKLELARIDTAAGMVVIKRVSADAYRHFVRTCANPLSRPEANQGIVLASVVYPSPDTFAEWCEKFPGIEQSLSAPVVEFAGSDVTAKKA